MFKTYDTELVNLKCPTCITLFDQFLTENFYKFKFENWGSDSPIHALRKESNWLEFVQLIPEKDAIYEKLRAKIKSRQSMDQYLLPHNSFIELNDDEVI